MNVKRRDLVIVLLLTFLATWVTARPTAAQSPDGAVHGKSAADLTVTTIEPTRVVDNTAGTLSLYGTGFSAGCVVRVVDFGLLGTTFVNETALMAQLPGGIAAGTYTVEVSDGLRTARLEDVLRVRTPEPVPTPEPPDNGPPLGRPILTIRNYKVEPAQVRAGEEFVVTIEIYNNGSRAGENTMAVFPGTTFLPVGEPGHMIWQLHINHTAVVSQRMRAPGEMSSGLHQVQVNMMANDWAGDHYEYPATVPVEVIGKPDPGDFKGQPKVVIEGATTDPVVLVPGEPFSLTLTLANRGSRTAVNVFATSAAGDMAIPAAGGDTVSTPKIGIGETVSVTLPLMVAGDIESGGRQTMAMTLAYSDHTGSGYTAQQNIGVDINTSLTRSPQLIIEAYTTEPAFLSPGDTFTLTLNVSNVGGGDAGRLTLALGGQDGASLAPFIPLKSGNVLFVDEVAKGESVRLARQLIVDGSADAKAYNLPIALAYDDPHSARQEDVQRLSLIVRKQPELQAGFYRPPDTLAVGMGAPVALEVVNIGRSSVNVSKLEATSPQMDVVVEGIPFVGPLDAGGSAALDLRVTPQEPGPTELVISVHYRDDFNQTQIISDTLEIEIPEGGPVGSGGPVAPGGPMGLEGEPGLPAGEPQPQLPETMLQKIGRVVKRFLGFRS